MFNVVQSRFGNKMFTVHMSLLHTHTHASNDSFSDLRAESSQTTRPIQTLEILNKNEILLLYVHFTFGPTMYALNAVFDCRSFRRHLNFHHKFSHLYRLLVLTVAVAHRLITSCT